MKKKFLNKKKVLITRAHKQAKELSSLIEEYGGIPIEFPTIEIIPPDNFKDVDLAISRIKDYNYIIFTSVNGVKYFFDRLFTNKDKDLRSLGHLQTAVIGPATEKRLFDYGIKSDIVPESYIAESILNAFKKKNLKGKRILLPRAKEARPILPEGLKKMGAVVDEVAAYCTQIVPDNSDILLKHLEAGTIDVVTFTSSSTVKNFHSLLPHAKLEKLMRQVVVASIGPITADTAKNLGFNVQIIAELFTIPGLCEAILQHYQ